jgi:hypothetical protein
MTVQLNNPLAVGKPAGICPVGAIIAWAKSLGAVTPALTDEWVECNGQTLSGGLADAQSVYNGKTLPSLNTPTNRPYLRGNSTSGGTGGGVHSHTITLYSSVYMASGGSDYLCIVVNYEPSTSSDYAEPYYYDVVWILRKK